MFENKKALIEEIKALNVGNRNLNSKILQTLKDDLKIAIADGYNITDIQKLLKMELDIDINYKTLQGWIYRNILGNTKRRRKEKDIFCAETKANNNIELKIAKTVKVLNEIEEKMAQIAAEQTDEDTQKELKSLREKLKKEAIDELMRISVDFIISREKIKGRKNAL